VSTHGAWGKLGENKWLQEWKNTRGLMYKLFLGVFDPEVIHSWSTSYYTPLAAVLLIAKL
jgi:hypothetical protein